MAISDIFKDNSETPAPAAGHEHHHSGAHSAMMWAHGILMLGMLLPMVASAVPLGAATLGDAAVQTLHMVGNMITGLTDNFSVLTDIASNSLDGEFAAATMEAGSMHANAAGVHVMPGGALMTNVHGANASVAAASLGGAQVFSTPMEWFQSLPALNQTQMLEDANAFGIPFEQYITDWCNNNQMTFGHAMSPR